MLASEDPAARYRELLAERADVYGSVATIEIDAHGDPEVVTDALVDALAKELIPERTR